MGRAFAGTVGPLAFALTVARGVLIGSSLEATLLTASAALFAFAALGYVAGQTADYLVRDSVRSQFQTAMANWQRNKNETQPNPTT
jgi:hypothetical protein